MKDYVVVVRVPGTGAQNIEAVAPDGRELEGAVAGVAKKAIREAADRAGGSPMLVDDNLLDQEGPGGDLDLAVGIIVTALASAGYPCRVVRVDVCEACDAQKGPAGCRVCGGRGEVDYEAPPDPKGDA